MLCYERSQPHTHRASDPCIIYQAKGQRQATQVGTHIIQVSPYFDPTYTRTGWIGQPPVLDRHEVVTIDGDVDTLRQATP